ncbi:MAG TPA: hypothetical protein VGM91_15765 [Conexibacter sp.]
MSADAKGRQRTARAARRLSRAAAAAGRAPRDVLAAAAVAATVSAAPSTLDALLRGDDLLASSRAAGAMLVGDHRRPALRLAAAVPVHVALSVGWTALLSATLPPRREPLYGGAAGLAIAAIDLAVIGRRFPSIAALPQPPQWADHVAFGLAVGVVLRRRRRVERRA